MYQLSRSPDEFLEDGDNRVYLSQYDSTGRDQTRTSWGSAIRTVADVPE